MTMNNRPEKAEAATDCETRMTDFRKRPVLVNGRPVIGHARCWEPSRRRADPEGSQGARLAQFRRRPGAVGLQHGRQERVERFRRGYLPRRGGGILVIPQK